MSGSIFDPFSDLQEPPKSAVVHWTHPGWLSKVEGNYSYLDIKIIFIMPGSWYISQIGFRADWGPKKDYFLILNFGFTGVPKIGPDSLNTPRMVSKDNFEARNEFSTSEKHYLDTKIVFLPCLELKLWPKPFSGVFWTFRSLKNRSRLSEHTYNDV